MKEHDIVKERAALKSVIKGLGPETLLELTGFKVERWLDVELPELRNQRVDMLGETADGQLVHIELQSTNDPQMALRMVEYGLGVYERVGRFPEPIVLYVGEPPVRMETRLEAPNLRFEYCLVDIRDIDSERPLASGELGGNVTAILTALRSQREAVRSVLDRIAASRPDERGPAFQQLLFLTGLREVSQDDSTGGKREADC